MWEANRILLCFMILCIGIIFSGCTMQSNDERNSDGDSEFIIAGYHGDKNSESKQGEAIKLDSNELPLSVDESEEEETNDASLVVPEPDRIGNQAMEKKKTGTEENELPLMK